MKFLNYLSTLFVPTKMALRKNINVIISFLILVLGSYVLAFPYIKTFEPIAYEVYCNSIQYDFRALDREVSEEAQFTEEEKTDLSKKYVLSNVNEFKNINFSIKGGKVVVPDTVDTLKDLEYNSKEYLLKRNVFNYDADGTKLDKVDTYYVHIVFDIFEKIDDAFYRYQDDFDKRLNFSDENHLLLVFYIDGFLYRNNYLVENNTASLGFAYLEDTEMNFKDIDEIDYITRGISEMLIPQTKTQYTFNSFIYAVIAPFAIALCGYIFNKNKNILFKYKHYFNIAALCSIPTLLLFFILEWNKLMLSIGIMELYWVVLALYFIFVLSKINRLPNPEK